MPVLCLILALVPVLVLVPFRGHVLVLVFVPLTRVAVAHGMSLGVVKTLVRHTTTDGESPGRRARERTESE